MISVDDFTDNKICFETDLLSDSESEEEDSLDSEDEQELEKQKTLDAFNEEKETRRRFDDKIKRDNEKPIVDKAKDFVGLFTLPKSPKAKKASLL